MATLVFSAVGTALGGPIGGAIGSLVGRQIDSALFEGTRKGPRLKELEATTSTYGQIIPRHYGTMRVAGSIIWATELVEHDETTGTGKGSPPLTTYSYTANFAVALSSRPILGIGRIWADGKLLRGREGDLKVGGTLRVHTGHADQEPDPLLASSEGIANCPAYRDMAYVVFEGLDLGAYYNHIPALTFEVFADEAFTLQDIVHDGIDRTETTVELEGISGFTCEDVLSAALDNLSPLVPLDIDSSAETLLISGERLMDSALPLAEPSRPVDSQGFGAQSGYQRRRAAAPHNPLALLRYYDRDRDYLPGVQRAPGQAGPGEPAGLDLPAALDAAGAAQLIRKARYRSDWSRETLSWRTTELDLAVRPGTLVTLPDRPGHWRVREWEWCDSGVELTLNRVMPRTNAQETPPPPTVGRYNAPLDMPIGTSALIAYELPLDSALGTSDAPRTFAALSSASPGWQGATLYLDHGDGNLLPLGSTSRARAKLGTLASALPSASPHIFDRGSQLDVTLLDPSMQLVSASADELAQGANLALVGEELIQFAQASPLGSGQWRLEGLLRGRGGTEAGISTHVDGETFLLVDSRAWPVDPVQLGSGTPPQIVAIGIGDTVPVRSPVHLEGLTRRPLSPVHARRHVTQGAGLHLAWTRRARGAWLWSDRVDVPLVEESERYLVTYASSAPPIAAWYTTTPELEIAATTLSNLATQDPLARFQVQQEGTHGLSLPLDLGAAS